MGNVVRFLISLGISIGIITFFSVVVLFLLLLNKNKEEMWGEINARINESNDKGL